MRLEGFLRMKGSSEVAFRRVANADHHALHHLHEVLQQPERSASNHSSLNLKDIFDHHHRIKRVLCAPVRLFAEELRLCVNNWSPLIAVGDRGAKLKSISKERDALVMHPALETITRPAVSTSAAAYYLNRRPQTLRCWASLENGPLQPIRVNGRLAWSVSEIRRLLGVVL